MHSANEKEIPRCQRRQQQLAIGTELDAAEAAKDLRALRLRLPGDDDDILAAGIEANAADLQLEVRAGREEARPPC